jgi:hypothetical protein
VIDVGAFDGLDIAYPAYQNGYTVVSFELMTQTQNNIIENWETRGLVRDVHFRVIDVGGFGDSLQKNEDANMMYLSLQDDGSTVQSACISLKAAPPTRTSEYP